MVTPSSINLSFRLHPITLSFPGDLEASFRRNFFQKSLQHVRLASVIAIFFYGLFGILDFWLVPEVKYSLWFIRYAVFSPVALAFLLISFSARFEKYSQGCISVLIMAAGLGIIAMILIAPSPGGDSYYAGLILVLIFGYTFFKLRFIWATLTGWLIVLAYEICAVYFHETPLPILINNNFFFLSGNILGMFAGYSIEFYTRKDFLQTRLLEIEKRNVDVANRKLEKRVSDRTNQLFTANEDLKIEIAERKKADESLRASETRYRTIVESIEEGYFELDLAGRMIFFNDSLCRISGYAREELLGKSNREYTTPDTAKQMYNAFSHVYRTGNPARILDYDILRKDGSKVTVEISVSLICDYNGNPAGFRGVARDITQRRNIEIEMQKVKEAAESANKAKSDFLANMSHELRTPLNHIIGFTEMIVDKKFGELSETQEEYLSDVLQSGRHLLSLINDILDLSKIEAGAMTLELRDINIRGLLENSLLMIKEKALNHRIALSSCVNGTPPLITADERKLKQILYNLLSNAVKFTPDGGAVSLKTRKVDPSVLPIPIRGDRDGNGNGRELIEFAVADTGIGLMPEVHERIFDRFEQVDGSSGRKYQGTGLGLSLTKQLVELHGGRIWLESQGQGKGAVFRFVLPLGEKI